MPHRNRRDYVLRLQVQSQKCLCDVLAVDNYCLLLDWSRYEVILS